MANLLQPDDGVVIHDVVGGNLDQLPALIALFTESFPDYAAGLPRIRRKAEQQSDSDPRFVRHQWLIEVEDAAAGMASFTYVPARNLGLGIYLAVRPAYRRRPVAGHSRLAGWLHAAIGQQLERDAVRAGQPPPWGLAVEVATPALAIQYRQYGFLELPIAYAEPQFRQDRGSSNAPPNAAPVSWRPARLGLFPCVGREVDVRAPQLLMDIVSAFMIDHYGFPAECADVQRALAAAARPDALGGDTCG
jgi:GNAT superfamily N-acetyltransferase